MAEWRFEDPGIDYTTSDYIPPAVQAGYWDRTHLAADLVRQIREPGQPVVDVGCNAGHLLDLVGAPCWGYDIADSPLAFGLDAGRPVRKADITVDALELGPVVTICEVLEHLPDPHRMVARLNQAPVRYVVASGPYQETPDAHYEQHVWAWDLDGFAALFTRAGFRVVKQATADIFQALIAVRGE